MKIEEIHIHDPKVTKEQIKKDLNSNSNLDLSNNEIGKWEFSRDIYKVIERADAIIILTEWDEYKNLDWNRISNKMRNPSWIFDTRSVTNEDEIKKTKLSYWAIGNGSLS